jgi:phosphoserine phosphatase
MSSSSDLMVFRSVGYSIALNADARARAAADVQIDTDDLRELLPLLAGPR